MSNPVPGFQDPQQQPQVVYVQQPKKKHTVRNVLLGIVGFIVLLIVIGSVANSGNKGPGTVVANPPAATESAKKADSKDAKPSAEPKAAPKITKGQEQALRSAESYLEFSPFSKKGLIKQLKYEKFSTEDATWAAENVGADWNEQAVKAAVRYLDTMAFSEADLAKQLEFEGFTKKQAKHGASEAYKQ